MGNIFAVGDIHGTYDKLLALMEMIDIDPEQDTLVFIGDYIDRGFASYEVVDYLINIRKQFRRMVLLKGNHEEMFENYLAGNDKFTYLINGGQHTLDSYLKHSRLVLPVIPSHHLDFYNSLVLYYETDDYVFVHAGLRENVPVDMQSTDDLLWIRRNFIYSEYDFGKRVVFGHTPFPEPLVQKNKIGIDTGAVYGNLLTCVKLPEMKFFSV